MHLAQHACSPCTCYLKYSSTLQTTKPWLPYLIWLHSHPDMLQVFAVDRVEDAVGSYQLHSTLYVDINYSSTLAVLKREKRRAC